MKRVCSSLLFLGLLMFMGCSNTTPPVSTVQQVQDPGEALFLANCSGCHGGGGNTLLPEKPVKGSAKLVSLQVFQQFLRNPSGNMPTFAEEQLSQEQLKQLYQYLAKTYR